jgi:hypothetical protein
MIHIFIIITTNDCLTKKRLKQMVTKETKSESLITRRYGLS